MRHAPVDEHDGAQMRGDLGLQNGGVDLGGRRIIKKKMREQRAEQLISDGIGGKSKAGRIWVQNCRRRLKSSV